MKQGIGHNEVGHMLERHELTNTRVPLIQKPHVSFYNAPKSKNKLSVTYRHFPVADPFFPCNGSAAS